MEKTKEPSVKISTCSYCGNAPINHSFSFWESFVFTSIETWMSQISTYTPSFLEKAIDLVPKILFETTGWLGFTKFSEDIEKANNFRSKIIWEEAKRRSIKMEQVIFFGKPLDQYRAFLSGKKIYFESIPSISEATELGLNWDDKIFLKKELRKSNIPVPDFFKLPLFMFAGHKIWGKNLAKIFTNLEKPLVIKPRGGSRGRHTATNIKNLDEFHSAIKVAGQISPYLIIEEYLNGDVCRATLVDGKLAGFYRGHAPTILGDGRKTIRELILEKDIHRQERVAPVRMSKEFDDHISRFGYVIDDVLPKGVILSLSHRIGRLFGGKTTEMIDKVHPSFLPIFEKAAKVTKLSVVGFDAIIPDPTKPADSQKWGIIECNSLPFIDLHYYALEGKPRNIAGMIWDMWK